MLKSNRISSSGRSRWRTAGWAALIYILMFVINVIGQLWDQAAIARPFSLFFYYQPQKIWLLGEWNVNMSEAWPGAGTLPVVPFLLGLGFLGYGLAYRIFTRRDLPAPL